MKAHTCLAGLLLIGGLLSSTTANGHAVVYPRESKVQSWEKYVLRVPNERSVATTKLRLQFPEQLRIVSFGDVAGWSVSIERDSIGRITAAEWSGNLPVERFVEFPFIATNPPTATVVMWPAVQTYADGVVVEWTGPPDSKTPASSTTIVGGEPNGGH